MRFNINRALVSLTFILFAVGCDSTLSVEPVSDTPEDRAIVDPTGARAALAGAYDALQDGSYYGGELLFFSDLPSEDVDWVGTFTDYAEADDNSLRTQNGSVETIWESLYAAVGSVNQLIKRLATPVTGLDDAERDDMLGQSYFLRALTYHNLVKLWGGVPLRLEPAPSVNEASQISRSTEAEVYTQILSDLDQAELLIANTSDLRRATLGAVDALRSRVYLYQEDWANTIVAADAVIAAGYSLAPNFSDLFTPDGQDTPEDIFRVSFTPQEFTNVGFYYISRSFGGRRELSPSFELIDAFGFNADPNYDPDTLQTTNDDGDLTFQPLDQRAAWSISFDARNRRYGSKYPTTEGAEDQHVIRFAEVLLNKAEALAQLGQLSQALAIVNQIRARAGIPNVVATSQQAVIDAIWTERRLELAFEGFRWPDLVRTGQAEALLSIPAFQTLFPIPQNEVDVAPNIAQNPGY
ncbi:MAG: RagB/SusD family nutrient uptake outer membrane protein [Anaerolineae bacterium]|nr:RagB/SusD family nutrient uptake outer membrane protein [Gemmatimonadaceae bacterium]